MGIWDYSAYFTPDVDEYFRLSLAEGKTECEKYPSLADELGLDCLFLKREDANPTGSHKDRSLALQISAHLQDGAKEFVISSSGNAAISAAKLLSATTARLHIFISNNIPESKLWRLEDVLGEHNLFSNYKDLVDDSVVTVENISIHISSRAKSDAFKFAKENDYVFLRGSTDPYAVEGFKTIAFELAKQAPEADAIFIPCSSGTSTQGIYEGYQQLFKEGSISKIPQIHVVQSTKVHPIAKEFDKDFTMTEDSLVEAIVDRVAHRKPQAILAINETEGFGWVVSDDYILKGQKLLESAEVECSPEGGMVMGAVIKAKEKGFPFNCPVILITGRK